MRTSCSDATMLAHRPAGVTGLRPTGQAGDIIDGRIGAGQRTKFMTLHNPALSVLSASQLQSIGSLCVNWGSVDSYLFFAIVNGNLGYTQDYLLKVVEYGMGWKIETIEKAVAAGKMRNEVERYINEIRRCFKDYKSSRNLVAHGLPTFYIYRPTLFHPFRGVMELDALPTALEQSVYTCFISNWMVQAVVGNDHAPEWPEAPAAIIFTPHEPPASA